MSRGRSARGHRDAADASADDHAVQPSSDGRTGAPDGPAGGGRSLGRQLQGTGAGCNAYGSIELRQFSDLELLVRRAELPRVAETLTAEGIFSPHTRREGLATGYFQEYEDAFVAQHAMGSVDVHWNVTPRSFRFAPDEEALRSRARLVELEFGTVTAIAPEDLLLYMCVHAAEHGWPTLGLICDVAETVRARPAIALTEILGEASVLGSRRMFLTSIYLAHELVGAPIPADRVAIARGDRGVTALAGSVARQLFSGDAPGWADFDPWAIPMRSIEGVRARTLGRSTVSDGGAIWPAVVSRQVEQLERMSVSRFAALLLTLPRVKRCCAY
jgi:hypothetical protein